MMLGHTKHAKFASVLFAVSTKALKFKDKRRHKDVPEHRSSNDHDYSLAVNPIPYHTDAMILKLCYPWTLKWKSGYLVTNKKERRRTVILYNNQYDRSSVSYARYLAAVHLRRFLLPTEEVDHKNSNSMDDRISNYEIISGTNNRKKQWKPRYPSPVTN